MTWCGMGTTLTAHKLSPNGDEKRESSNSPSTTPSVTRFIVSPKNTLQSGQCTPLTTQQLHLVFSLNDQRMACMLLFTVQSSSTSFWDVLSFPCISCRSTMMSLRAPFAMLSFSLALSFVLSMWAIYLTALSAWICSLATTVRSLTVVFLKLL